MQRNTEEVDRKTEGWDLSENYLINERLAGSDNTDRVHTMRWR